jgi:alanine racemase
MRHEMRRAWVEVDLDALKRNAERIIQRARVPLLPMVKSDAYGLGVDAVVRTLETLAPWGYGVATVDEGAGLRRLGVARPIVVFTPLLSDELADAHRLRLTPTLGDARRMEAWHSSGGGPWHLAIDTGMNRSGAAWDRVAELTDLLAVMPPEGAFTHFHSAERNDGSLAVQQQRFREAISKLPAPPPYLHAENSPAVERQSPSPWTLARPGVFLYGGGGEAGAEMAPECVASLHARIADMRTIRAGDTVSYGATWTAKGTRRIATAAAGYADGIRRCLGNRSHALVKGRLAPIVGVVTMDMAMLDVTDIDCDVGDVATFLGRQGTEELALADVARAGDLSPYELLVGLKLRAPRVYLEATP